MFRRILRIINFILIIFCIINSCELIYRLVNPRLPTNRVYKAALEDIEFPLSFRICLNYRFEIERYRDLGYDSRFDFYLGKSMYNKSLVGWNGHTKTGSTIGTTNGKKMLSSKPILNPIRAVNSMKKGVWRFKIP